MASPVIHCLHLCGKICRRKLWRHSGNCSASGDNAAFGGLGYYAFVHRKSERTGMAFVFPWVGTVSKISDCGTRRTWNRTYFLYAVQVTVPELIWWIFGLILGTLLAGGIMEIIYYRDFRKFFSHKIQFVVNGACVALVACVFLFDLTGYDELYSFL